MADEGNEVEEQAEVPEAPEAEAAAVSEEPPIVTRVGTAQPDLRWSGPARELYLALLEEKGPLLSRDIPDTAAVPWVSTATIDFAQEGYTPDIIASLWG